MLPLPNPSLGRTNFYQMLWHGPRSRPHEARLKIHNNEPTRCPQDLPASSISGISSLAPAEFPNDP